MTNEAVERQVAHRGETAVSLGDVLSKLMENRVVPRQSRAELISQAWRMLLPSELRRHCRIVDIAGGRLKVIADSPSYMYELKLLSCELLIELTRRYPRARIKEIKVAVG
jgi:hypothetical protein